MMRNRSKIEYWNERLSRYEIAAICNVNVSTLSHWKRYGSIPNYAIRLLELYTGELSQDDWEDLVQEKSNKIRKKNEVSSKC